MFPSISSCDPGTFVTSTFTADFDTSIGISSSYTITVNNVLNVNRPITVIAGQSISVMVISPATFSGIDFIPYTINGSSCQFAIANKSDIPISILSEAYQKKWWNYLPVVPHKITYRGVLNKSITLDLGYNTNNISDGMHAIIDPLSQAIYFYSQAGLLLKNLVLPSAPAQIIKVADYFIAVCTDGLYKITYNQQVIRETVLQNNQIGPMTDWLFELPFETDIPLKGSFLAFAAHKLTIIDSHRPHCISYSASRYWVGGYKKIWQLDENFNLLKIFTKVSGLVTGIQSLGTRAIYSSKFGSINLVDESQTDSQTLLYQSRWVGPPVMYGKYVAFADANSSKIKLLDTTTADLAISEILTPHFAPSYLIVDSSILYISGHDSRTIKIYNGTAISEQIFPDRVTSVSVLNGTIIASHYLRKNNTLDHTGHKEIIPVQVKPIKSGLTVAGFKPIVISMLGESSIIPSVPDGVQWFADGILGAPLTDGCLFSASYNTTFAGIKQFPILLGQSVIDLFIVSADQNYIPKNIDLKLNVSSDNAITQVDFIIPADFTPTIASIDYGYLLKNFDEYCGFSTLGPGDVLSICTPYGKANNTVSVCTIGGVQFNVPINSSTVKTTVTSIVNTTISTVVSTDFTISTSGLYSVPNNVKLKVNGIVIPPGQVLLTAGDVILLSVTSSPRTYDKRRVIITGPSNFELVSITNAPSTITKINLGTLTEPLIRQQYTSSAQIISGLGTMLDQITQAIIINSAVLISLDPSILISKNTDDPTNLVQVVDGDTVTIIKNIKSLSDPSVIIYQQLVDPLFDEPVYVDVIKWDIVNPVISGAQVESKHSMLCPVFNCINYQNNNTTFNTYALGFTTSKTAISAGISRYAYNNPTASISPKFNYAWQSSFNTLISFAASVKWQSSFNTLISFAASSEFQTKFSSPFALRNITEFYSTNTDIISSSYAFELLQQLNENYISVIHSITETSIGFNTSPIYSSEKELMANLIEVQPFVQMHSFEDFYLANPLQTIHSVDSTLYANPLQTVILIESQKQFDVFASIIEHAEYQITDNFEYVVIEQADKTSQHFDNIISGEIGNAAKNSKIDLIAEKDPTNFITPFSCLIKADQQLASIVQGAQIYADSPKLMVIEGYDVLSVGELIWSVGPINNYGAYDTADLAAASANYRGDVPFMTVQIPGSDKFTYRKLSDLSRVCTIGGGTPIGITVLYGLIKGG